MKQILQSLKTGATEVADVPTPCIGSSSILIRSTRTLISAGTERVLVEFGKASWIEKARQQPDKVRQVLDKIKTDGLVPTIETVLTKLDQPLPLGYCNTGVVSDVGFGISRFAPGDRVVSNGRHAEVVSVPVNLCAKVPDGVPDDEAAFTVVGAIALQGIRLAQPNLGESVVVIGLGLVGLMAVQLLQAQGCRVLGIDIDSSKLELARQFGAKTVDLSAGQDPLAVANRFSRGRGVDAVLITASTKSSEPVHQAAQMCRKRGQIILVGVTGLELSRADFYEKELTFQVSCSYGPGRHDPNYEEKGQDYPYGFVRWTEKRNMDAVLDMMADDRIDVKPLISHRFPIAEAENAYEVLGGSESSLGMLLEYPGIEITTESHTLALNMPSVKAEGQVAVSFIGAGNYAARMLIPAFKASKVRLRTVASSGGVSGAHAGRKFGFEQTTTDADSVFADEDTNAVVIATRHDSHAQMVITALEAGKHVFVEKPLCITLDELTEIDKAIHGSDRCLMVGFNRRFAPQVLKIKRILSGVSGPKSFVMTVNAGAISQSHWTQDVEVGGGRIIGEACHFVDLLRHLAGASIVDCQRMAMKGMTNDTTSLQLRFADGSIGTVHYFANGSKTYPKERLEVFVEGRVLQLDNFRRLRGYGWPGFRKMNLWRQDKGQTACAATFVNAVKNGDAPPIPIGELLEVSRATIALAES